jgi:UDP-glucose 4-epimerase
MEKGKRLKNIVITGSRGYIGTNLKAFLNKKRCDVWEFDKVDSRRPDNAVERLTGIGSNMDLIVHLAAFPGIANCMSDFDRAVIDNISNSYNIFKIAYNQGIPLIFASSQAAKDPHDNLYATIKRICEIEADRLNRLGADIRVFRLTNVYGGDKYLEKKNTVVKMFVKAREKKQRMVINGDGSQVRDFIHVDDVCRAIWLCGQRKNGFLTPVDVGTGEGVSIKKLAEMIKSEFTFDEKSAMIGISKSVANPKLAYKLFGFKAKKSLKTYLKGV